MLTLVWDVDDVLNDFMRCWFEKYWLSEHLDCPLSYDDIRENPPHRILGVELEEYFKSIDGFRLSKLFQEMPPNREVYEWFCEYGSSFRHIALSAVPRSSASSSAWWIFKHFGNWIRSFAFIPSQRLRENLPTYDSTKADYIRWLKKADVFIEDNENNVAGLKEDEVRRFVVCRPWNLSKTEIKEVLSKLCEMRNGKDSCKLSAKRD